ncbi:SRPBCC family protein [Pseudorhodobacter sp.]|uniref:SRPBCC family protein n=1 Tax=Pseudorhodobacter sp. TaxID=1934400 RepID=UPI00264954F1|nr:SRPBCC family protein [Pseudorhodobacter sp.]MDN5787532.1 SRPBCC family protein [Pseudorhodobacter sp.]
MKLTAKEDIEAPIAFVDGFLTDFDNWERAALRRGAEVERLDRLPKPAAGMEWKICFPYRAKQRDAQITLTKIEQERALSFLGIGRPVEAVLDVDMAEMGPRRTRVHVQIDIKPRTLAARLFVQSLRLAKSKVTKRYAQHLSQLAADIEDRYRAQLKG